MTAKAFFFLLILVILPNTTPKDQPVNMSVWLKFVKVQCEVYRVDPNFALAVAMVESGVPGELQLRFGRLGKSKYYGPFGIHRCFNKWGLDLSNPYVNAWIGIRALRGVGKSRKKQIRRLRKYNASFDWSYWRAIKSIERRNKKRKIFERGAL